MINVDFNSETIYFSGQEVGKFYLTDRDKFLVLSEIRINPDFRGSGYAQETMEQIINHANEKGKILALTPSSDFGANKNKLIEWYKSLGFIMNKGRNKNYETMELMFKEPDNNMNEMIRREIWTMNEDGSPSFNLEEFDQLTSFAARKRYADENLNKIGAGTARIVYRTPDGKVLKLAKNQKGIAQNEVECEKMNDYYIGEYITEIFNCHPNNLWVLAEEAKKINPNRFKELTGVTIDDLNMFLSNMNSQNNGGQKIYSMSNEEEMHENEFSSGIYNIMMSYGMPAGDLGRISSYGEVIRDGQPDVVIVDYGLSDDVYSSHYSRMGESYKEYFGGEDINEVQFQMQDHLDNAAEDANIKDGGYAGNAFTKTDDLVGDDLEDINEYAEDYRDISVEDLKASTDFIEKHGDVLKPTREMFSKLFTNYLIGSQNINNALKISNNNVNFYNNLMNMQKFFKKFGLIKEDLVYWSDENLNESRRILSTSAYKDIDDNDVKESIKFIKKIKNKINTKEYLSEEEFDDILFHFQQISLNPKKYTKFISWEDYYSNKNYLRELLVKRGILKEDLLYWGVDGSADSESDEYKLGAQGITEDGTSLYTTVQGTVDSGDMSLNENDGVTLETDRNPSNPSFNEIFTFKKDGAILEIGQQNGRKTYGILELFVPEENRRQGVARLLMQKALNYFVIDGFTGQASNDKAINLNYGLGFRSFDDDGNELSLEDTKKKRAKQSSINMWSPDFIKKNYEEIFNKSITEDDWDIDEMMLEVKNDVITERIMSWMPKSKAIKVKRECQIGGKADGTSKACNQGDMGNIELTDINDDNKHRRKANTTNVAEDDKWFDKKINETVTQLMDDAYKESMIKEADIMSLNDLPFKDEVERLGGKIFSVGGAVRDKFLGKDSKDLDILITGVPLDNLLNLLKKYGTANLEGKSFGVIKFVPKGAVDDIDIAIPRTEKATGEGGHKGFDVQADHTLPIEDDLKRRDFTINAIAKDKEGNLIDPYNGQEDLKNKILRVVNPEAFSDDPLRMLRGVQFAARFDFKFEPKTYEQIKANAPKISEIAPDRILIELEKIVEKSDKRRMGAQLLKDTGLYKEIFGVDLDQSTIDNSPWEKVKTLGDFMYLLMRDFESPNESFISRFLSKKSKRSNVFKEMKGLDQGFKNVSDDKAKNRFSASEILKFDQSGKSFKSEILPEKIKQAVSELDSGLYPKSTNELAINGNDLQEIGYKKDEFLGKMLNMLLFGVYKDDLKNNREELLNFAKK